MKTVQNKIGKLVYKTLDELIHFQGGLKGLSKDGYQKLKKSFLENGNIAPVFIWQNNILDGHQRVATLKQMKAENSIKLPDEIPCIEIKARSKKQAKKFVLQYVSQFGKINQEGLYEYISENELVDDWDDLKLEIDLPDFDLDNFERGWLDDEIEGKIEDDYIPPTPEQAKTKRGDAGVITG